MELNESTAPFTADSAEAVDYNAMVKRLHFLSIVQKLAHDDVLRMIEAVGIEALMQKELFDVWRVTGASRGSKGGYDERSRSGKRRPPFIFPDDALEEENDDTQGRAMERSRRSRSTRRGTASGAAGVESRWSTSVKVMQNGEGGGRSVRSRSQFRSENEQNAFFSKLASPHNRRATMTAPATLHHQDSQADWLDEPHRIDGAGGPLGIPVRGGPSPPHRIVVDGDSGGAHALMSPTFGHSVEDDGGRRRRSATYSGILTSGSGGGFQSKNGPKSLGPKAKPMGVAADSTVPMNVVRQAAQSLRGDDAGKPASPHASGRFQLVDGEERTSPLGTDPRGASGSSIHADRSSTTAFPPLKDGEDGDENEARRRRASSGGHLTANASSASFGQENSADQLMAMVNSMLQAQEEAFRGIVNDVDFGVGAPPPGRKAGGTEQCNAGTMTSSSARHPKLASEYLEDAILMEGEEEDEDGFLLDDALVVSRIERRLDTMAKEMAQVQSGSDDTESLLAGDGTRQGETNKKKRQRGEMPEAMKKRLLSARVEAFEYIAYRERLWNTSRVSQFTFSQRLTTSLMEDAYNEVLDEVLGILDDYVEGLADHELQ